MSAFLVCTLAPRKLSSRILTAESTAKNSGGTGHPAVAEQKRGANSSSQIHRAVVFQPLSAGEHPAAQRERDQPGRSSRTCPCPAWWATSPEFACGSVRRLRLLGRARSTLIPCELCINFTAHIFAWVCASAWLWFCIMLHGFQVNFAYAFYSIMLDLHIYQYAAVFGITSRASAFVVRYALQSKSQK